VIVRTAIASVTALFPAHVQSLFERPPAHRLAHRYGSAQTRLMFPPPA